MAARRDASSGEETGTRGEHVIDVMLGAEALQKVVLKQNSPNPFKENTVIQYYIPKESKEAIIVIFDLKGDLMKEVPLQLGFGRLEVFAPDLIAGIYSYSIVVNGEVLDTKKMVVSK